MRTWNRDIVTNSNLSTVWTAMKEINLDRVHTPEMFSSQRKEMPHSPDLEAMCSQLYKHPCEIPKPTCQFSAACRVGHFLQDKFCPNWWQLCKPHLTVGFGWDWFPPDVYLGHEWANSNSIFPSVVWSQLIGKLGKNREKSLFMAVCYCYG